MKLNFSKLSKWKNVEKLKKVALSVIASQLNENEIKNLKELFQYLDANGDGTLTIQEIKDGLKNSKIKANSKEIIATFESIDMDKSNRIDYTEFLTVTMEKSVYLKEEKLYAAFKMFDKNDDGCIT